MTVGAALLLQNLRRFAEVITGKYQAALPVLLHLGASVTGAGLLAMPFSKDQPNEPRQTVENVLQEPKRAPVKAGVDRFGDPLPPGAVARLGTVRFRHEGNAEQLAFSPDGKILAGATRSGVLLWDAATGKELRRLPVPVGLRLPEHSLDFSPDGATLAVGAADDPDLEKACLTLWDVASGEKLHTFSVPAAPHIQRSFGALALSVRFAPDGKRLAVAGGAATNIHVLEIPAGRICAKVGEKPGSLRGPFFSPDGKALAIGAASGVRFYDASTGKLLRVFEVNKDRKDRMTSCLAYSPDGEVLAAASGEHIVFLNPATGEELGRMQSKHWANDLAFAPDGRTLVSCGQDGWLCVWDVAGRKVRRLLNGGTDHPSCMALSPDGKTAALGSQWQRLRLWNLVTGEELFTQFGDNDGPVNGLAFMPDGKTLFTGYPRKLVAWDSNNWQLTKSIPSGATSLSIRPDGQRLAVVVGGLHLWELTTGGEKWIGSLPINGFFRCARFSDDGKLLVTADEQWGAGKTPYGPEVIPRLRRWDAATGKSLGEMTLPEEARDAPAVAPDGKAAFVGGMEGSLYVIDLEAGRVRYQTPKRPNRFRAFTVSPDGGLLLAVDQSKEVSVWEVASRQVVLTLRGHRRTPGVTAFSPDGLLVGSTDVDTSGTDFKEPSTVRLWKLATGEELAKFNGFGADAVALTFVPDGTGLVAGLANSTALVFDVTQWARPRRPAENRLTAEEVQSLWADLGGADAPKAYRAGWALAAAPGQAVALFREKLRPVTPVDSRQLRQWIADLDSKEFAARRRAQAALSRLGGQAEQAVIEALKGKPSLEARRRLEQIRQAVEGVPELDALRTLRAIRVLERVGTPASRTVLEELARGATAAQETRAAREALVRLAARPSSP
jgi:WD40 repeat protein